MADLSLSELLGAPVYDMNGAVGGRVREVALCPQEDPARIAAIIVKTSSGQRMIPQDKIISVEGKSIRVSIASGDWPQMGGTEGFLLLERDLLDQQIIDVHGRKVVRVNDVDLSVKQTNGHQTLAISNVEVGSRGA